MSVKLRAGGAVRIYTDGGTLVSQVDAGQGSSLDVRHLTAGGYVARQETPAGLVEIPFEVTAGDEFARLPVDGETRADEPVGPGAGSGPVAEVREGVIDRGGVPSGESKK